MVSRIHFWVRPKARPSPLTLITSHSWTFSNPRQSYQVKHEFTFLALLFTNLFFALLLFEPFMYYIFSITNCDFAPRYRLLQRGARRHLILVFFSWCKSFYEGSSKWYKMWVMSAGHRTDKIARNNSLDWGVESYILFAVCIRFSKINPTFFWNYKIHDDSMNNSDFAAAKLINKSLTTFVGWYSDCIDEPITKLRNWGRS